MRGKRTATPLLWRDERAMPSKCSSKTCTGSTWRAGPNRATVCCRIQRSRRSSSSSVNPEYALATGSSSPPSHTANVMSVSTFARRPLPGWAYTSTASMLYGSIFHFHQSPRGRPLRYGESRRFSIRPSTPRPRACKRSAASSSQVAPGTSSESSRRPCEPARSCPRRARRPASGSARKSRPSISRRSYATKEAGASARIAGVSFCRPIRRCSTENGSGAPPEYASTSPSSTIPSGKAWETSRRSGNLSVISSSPRDQSQAAPPRRTS